MLFTLGVSDAVRFLSVASQRSKVQQHTSDNTRTYLTVECALYPYKLGGDVLGLLSAEPFSLDVISWGSGRRGVGMVVYLWIYSPAICSAGVADFGHVE